MGIKSSLKIPIKCVILLDEGILPIRNLDVHILRDITNMSLSATYREKEMSTHSSILAWRIPWTEEPGGLLSIGVAQSRTRLKRLSMPASIGEGNGNPLQCSCLENPRVGGAWWAGIYGVVQSQTRLKQFSSSSSHLQTWIGEQEKASGIVAFHGNLRALLKMFWGFPWQSGGYNFIFQCWGCRFDPQWGS